MTVLYHFKKIMENLKIWCEIHNRRKLKWKKKENTLKKHYQLY